MRVLEVACCEADWLHEAARAWPDVRFVGIDTRAPNAGAEGDRVRRRNADALNADLFEPESLDAVVSLSAIEHVGLGHYGDPIDPDGDSKAVANIWRWLKPGGWFYFDVPYDPSGYRVQGTKCRVYDTASLMSRVMPRGAWRGSRFYSEAAHASVLVPEPAAPATPFHYVAVFLQKPSSPDSSS